MLLQAEVIKCCKQSKTPYQRLSFPFTFPLSSLLSSFLNLPLVPSSIHQRWSRSSAYILRLFHLAQIHSRWFRHETAVSVWPVAALLARQRSRKRSVRLSEATSPSSQQRVAAAVATLLLLLRLPCDRQADHGRPMPSPLTVLSVSTMARIKRWPTTPIHQPARCPSRPRVGGLRMNGLKVLESMLTEAICHRIPQELLKSQRFRARQRRSKNGRRLLARQNVLDPLLRRLHQQQTRQGFPSLT